MSSKYDKFLTALLIIAGIAVVILIAYFGYDIYRKNTSNTDGEEAVDAFQEHFSTYNKILNEIDNNDLENKAEITDNNGNVDENNDSADENSGTTTVGNTGTKKPSSNSSYTANYNGFTMIGTIQIPKINVKKPILKEISPKALQKGTSLIYGQLNQGENAVIIGHNNRNGTFFSNLKKLSNGDKITITDSTGKQVTYQVYNKFQATPDDTSFYQRDTNGKSEVTLSTCTDNDDSKRIIVLAREI